MVLTVNMDESRLRTQASAGFIVDDDDSEYFQKVRRIRSSVGVLKINRFLGSWWISLYRTRIVFPQISRVACMTHLASSLRNDLFLCEIVRMLSIECVALSVTISRFQNIWVTRLPRTSSEESYFGPANLPPLLTHPMKTVQHMLPAMFSAIYIMQIKGERWLIVSVEPSTVLPFIALFNV